jgi:hypothetical protein
MYVIIREHTLTSMCPAELHYCAYGCTIYVKAPIHPVIVVNKTFKIQIVKSSGSNTNHIVVLISVLCPDGGIYISGVVLLV